MLNMKALILKKGSDILITSSEPRKTDDSCFKLSLCVCPLRSVCEINLEAELFTLQDSNSKLVEALEEANSSVEQWKKQLAEYQEETDRLRDQVMHREWTNEHLIIQYPCS